MYQKAVGALTLGVFPFILLFIFIAHSFIANVYGEKWLESDLPLQIMAIGAFAFLISITLRALIAAQNLVGREMPLQLARVLITIAVVAVAVPGGLTAIAIGIVIREILFVVLLKRMVSKAELGLTIQMMLFALFPTLVACIVGATFGSAAHLLLLPHTTITSVLYLFAMSASVMGGYGVAVLAMGRIWRSHAPLQASMQMVAGWAKRLPNGIHLAQLIHPPAKESK
jgi:O-antigen/teichoic acid export membrane protein